MTHEYLILVPGYEDVDADQWKSILNRVDLADPSQKEMAAHITTKYAAAAADGSKKPASGLLHLYTHKRLEKQSSLK